MATTRRTVAPRRNGGAVWPARGARTATRRRTERRIPAMSRTLTTFSTISASHAGGIRTSGRARLLARPRDPEDAMRLLLAAVIVTLTVAAPGVARAGST